MKNIKNFYLLIAILFFSIVVHATTQKEISKDFKLFLAQLKRIAKNKDNAQLAKITGPHFTVGEELNRESSLEAIKKNPKSFADLLLIVDHGGCYRTDPLLVQCESPDPGPELKHSDSKQSILLIAQRYGKVWKINVLSGIPNL